MSRVIDLQREAFKEGMRTRYHKGWRFAAKAMNEEAARRYPDPSTVPATDQFGLEGYSISELSAELRRELDHEEAIHTLQLKKESRTRAIEVARVLIKKLHGPALRVVTIIKDLERWKGNRERYQLDTSTLDRAIETLEEYRDFLDNKAWEATAQTQR